MLHGTATGDTVVVNITNLGPDGGTSLTPVFVGFHDGSFDLFDAGSAASSGLESVAEDGNVMPLTTDFTTGDRVSGAVGGITNPGGSASETFTLDIGGGANQFLSVATMVVPTNDFSTSAANFLFPELGDGQGGPNVGADENGVITLVDTAAPFDGFLNRPDGFNPGLAGLRVTVTAVPEPSSMIALGCLGAAGLMGRRRRRGNAKSA